MVFQNLVSYFVSFVVEIIVIEIIEKYCTRHESFVFKSYLVKGGATALKSAASAPQPQTTHDRSAHKAAETKLIFSFEYTELKASRMPSGLQLAPQLLALQSEPQSLALPSAPESSALLVLPLAQELLVPPLDRTLLALLLERA